MAESILTTTGRTGISRSWPNRWQENCPPCFRHPNLEGIRRRRRRAFISYVSIEISSNTNILRKEVIQPQVPLRLPCYDFTLVADPTVVGCFQKVSAPPSGKTNSHGVTGGVYKARERIHRGMLIHDY